MRKKTKMIVSFAVVMMIMISSTLFVQAKHLPFWWHDTPKTVYVYTGDLPTLEKSLAVTSMNTWNAVRTLDNQLMVTFTSTQNDFGADGRIHYGYYGNYVGYCQPYYIGDELRTFDITLNNAVYQFYNGLAAGKYDIRTIMTHELGHALGVAHCHEQGETCYSSTCSTNVMNRLAQVNLLRRTLKPYDIASYQYIYMYLD